MEDLSGPKWVKFDTGRVEKIVKHFPLFLRVKIQRISTGKQPKKIGERFPPFRGVKMGQFRSASDQKKLSIVVPLLQGNKSAVF